MSNRPLTRDEIRGMIRGAGGAKVFGGGNNFRDGKFVATILRMFYHQGHKGRSLIVEHLIEESEPQFSDIEPNRPGTTASAVFNYSNTENQSMVDANVKAYFCSIFGLDAGGTSEEKINEIIEAGTWTDEDVKRGERGAFGSNVGKELRANPFRGMKVRMETYRKATTRGKSVGTDDKGRPKFCANKWGRYEQSLEQVAQRRQELDAQGL